MRLSIDFIVQFGGVQDMIICDASKCTGCLACMNICPRDAIAIDVDDLGKTIPCILNNKCINCGLCRKVCPVNNLVDRCIPYKVYAAWSKIESDVTHSSSGGIASVFTRCFLSKGGVVFGARSHQQAVSHCKIDNVNEIDSIRGSKYVQSNTGLTYREAKSEVERGKSVLYIGTPCQIAGLQSYFGKGHSRLITIDLICHGTPPITYLQQHLASVIGEAGRWDSVSFRGKYNYVLVAYDNGDIVYKKPCEQDLYYKAYLKNLIFRDNCYSCVYANKERVSDITIADFWGIDRSTMKHSYEGRVSLVLINTEQGERFFNNCKDELIWEERTLLEAMSQEQTNIHHPSTPHKERQSFEQIYKKRGFEAAVKKTSIGKTVRKNMMYAKATRILHFFRFNSND